MKQMYITPRITLCCVRTQNFMGGSDEDSGEGSGGGFTPVIPGDDFF